MKKRYEATVGRKKEVRRWIRNGRAQVTKRNDDDSKKRDLTVFVLSRREKHRQSQRQFLARCRPPRGGPLGGLVLLPRVKKASVSSVKTALGCGRRRR